MSLVLAAGTQTGLLVFSGSQSPDTWKIIGQTLTGKAVTCSTIDAEGRLYVGSAGVGVHVTRDLESWSIRSEGLSSVHITALACDPLIPELVYCATLPAQLHVGNAKSSKFEKVTALRKVPSSDRWSSPTAPYQPTIRRIYPHPGRQGLVLLGVQVGGLYLTSDGGQSWQDRNQGLPTDLRDFQIHPDQPARIYAGTRVGFYRSDDLGVNWTEYSKGLTSGECHQIAVAAEAPNAVFCIVHRNSVGGPYLFRSADGGEHWSLCPGSLPFSAGLKFTAVTAARGWLFLGTSDGNIYGSNNFGETWQLYKTKLSAIHSLEVVYQN